MDVEFFLYADVSQLVDQFVASKFSQEYWYILMHC